MQLQVGHQRGRLCEERRRKVMVHAFDAIFGFKSKLQAVKKEIKELAGTKTTNSYISHDLFAPVTHRPSLILI